MLKFLRYALATVCFAASVACLALWGFSEVDNAIHVAIPLSSNKLTCEAVRGMAIVGVVPEWSTRSGAVLYFFTVGDEERAEKLGVAYERSQRIGRFGVLSPFIYFPLWFPVLFFGCAGVLIWRRVRFTLRSALIATTVVAGLLGIAVAL